MPEDAVDRGEILLREADRSAERLVSMARIAAAGTLLLALVFLAEPADLEHPEAAAVIRTAQVTLALWALAGVGGLFLVRSGAWRPWMAYVTVTIDVALLLANLAMNIRSTALSGDFISAFPAAAAIPLILVTSIIRMRPRVQLYHLALLLSGALIIALAAGQLPLEGRVPLAAELAPFFGFNGNVIRILMMVATGLVLVLAADRGRRLLLRAVAETRRRMNLGRYVPSELAHLLANSRIDELKVGRRSRVGLLFIDIRNSTSMEERLDAKALSAMINQFRARITRVAGTHEAIIDKFIGDGAFLVFGILEPKPDDASRALSCARDLLAAISDWSEERQTFGDVPVEVGIGVHYGDAFVGAIGTEDRLEFTVLGDAVNIAARLEQATKVYGWPLLISEDVLQAAGQDLKDYREVGEEPLRGRTEPIRIFTIAPPVGARALAYPAQNTLGAKAQSHSTSESALVGGSEPAPSGSA